MLMEMFGIIFVKLCVLQTEQGEDAGTCNAASLAPAMSKSSKIAFSVEVNGFAHCEVQCEEPWTANYRRINQGANVFETQQPIAIERKTFVEINKLLLLQI